MCLLYKFCNHIDIPPATPLGYIVIDKTAIFLYYQLSRNGQLDVNLILLQTSNYHNFTGEKQPPGMSILYIFSFYYCAK